MNSACCFCGAAGHTSPHCPWKKGNTTMSDTEKPGRDEIDLGDGHKMVFSNYKGEKRVGANVLHPPLEGKCGGQGWVAFEGRSWANSFEGTIATWKVEADEPITLSPSILCRACGDHGFIRDGKWVRA